MYAELDLKTCTKCGKPKPLSEFSNDKSRKDGKFPWCKVCKSIADSEDYVKNLDKVKANVREWRKKNPEQKRKHNSAYKKRHPDKVNANTKKYKKKHRGVTNANTARRRAALLQRTPKWLNAEQLKEIQLFYKAAAYIQDITGVEMHVDHEEPLQGEIISGLHVPWNLQILEGHLNESLKNKRKV